MSDGTISVKQMVAGDRGLSLGTMEEMWRFSTCLAKSGLAPKNMQSPEAILIAIQMGAEIGLSPMASVQNVAVINGRPSLWGDAMLAVCQSSGVFDHEAFEETISDTGGDLKASCTVRRLPNGKPVTRTFSMSEAKQAGLTGKGGPWGQYPRRMLQMRARSWALRDTFSDALRGCIAVEEAHDYQPLRQADVVTEKVHPPKLADIAADLAAAAVPRSHQTPQDAPEAGSPTDEPDGPPTVAEIVQDALEKIGTKRNVGTIEATERESIAELMKLPYDSETIEAGICEVRKAAELRKSQIG